MTTNTSYIIARAWPSGLQGLSGQLRCPVIGSCRTVLMSHAPVHLSSCIHSALGVYNTVGRRVTLGRRPQEAPVAVHQLHQLLVEVVIEPSDRRTLRRAQPRRCSADTPVCLVAVCPKPTGLEPARLTGSCLATSCGRARGTALPRATRRLSGRQAEEREQFSSHPLRLTPEVLCVHQPQLPDGEGEQVGRSCRIGLVGSTGKWTWAWA